MTIDWASFTPLSAAVGGAIIGVAAAMLLLLNGRVAASAASWGVARPRRGDVAWRIAFVAGLLLAPAVYALATRLPPIAIDTSYPALIVAGLMVGVGNRYGSGCTSGHGVCGLSRLSPRSLVATLVFMAAGFATVFVVRHLLAVSAKGSSRARVSPEARSAEGSPVARRPCLRRRPRVRPRADRAQTRSGFRPSSDRTCLVSTRHTNRLRRTAMDTGPRQNSQHAAAGPDRRRPIQRPCAGGRRAAGRARPRWRPLPASARMRANARSSFGGGEHVGVVRHVEHHSGGVYRSTDSGPVERRLRARQLTPDDPPVPALWPMMRSTVFMCRKLMTLPTRSPIASAPAKLARVDPSCRRRRRCKSWDASWTAARHGVQALRSPSQEPRAMWWGCT